MFIAIEAFENLIRLLGKFAWWLQLWVGDAWDSARCVVRSAILSMWKKSPSSHRRILALSFRFET